MSLYPGWENVSWRRDENKAGFGVFDFCLSVCRAVCFLRLVGLSKAKMR